MPPLEGDLGAVGDFEELAIKLFELRQDPLGGDAHPVIAAGGTHHAEGELLLIDADCHSHER